MVVSQMTKEQAIARLRELFKEGDAEAAHLKADDILLALLDDEEVAQAYSAIQKWYA